MAARALRAASWAGVAWFGAVAAAAQKPRAVMMAAGFCGFGSALSAIAGAACFAVGAGTICASAEANCRAAATGGFERGIGTASADLVSADFGGAAAATTVAGAGFSFTTGAA